MKTLPIVSAMVLWSGLALIAAGQNPQPPNKKDQGEGDQKLDTLAKVAKNMESSEDRLKKADPGDVTRKIQRDIVDLLDELIKQNNQPQGGQDGQSDKFSKSKSKSSQDKSGQSKTGQQNDGDANGQSKPPNPADQDMDAPGRAKTAKGEGQQGKKKDKGKGEDKEANSKDGGKDDKEGKEGKDGKKGEAKDSQEKDGSKQGGQGVAKNQKSSKTDLMADQHRSEWGHLPLTKRQEMDAYAKQRFMPRYDEALQEYYRTISEQAQRKK
jgi:hypothetical protein